MFRNRQLHIARLCGTDTVNTLYSSAVLAVQFVWGGYTACLGHKHNQTGAVIQFVCTCGTNKTT